MTTPNEYAQKKEEYRAKMMGAKSPKDAAEYKRLFRKARNQNIEMRKNNGRGKLNEYNDGVAE